MKKLICLVLVCGLVMSGCAFAKHTKITIKAKKASIKLKAFAPPIVIEYGVVTIDRTVSGSIYGKEYTT